MITEKTVRRNDKGQISQVIERQLSPHDEAIVLAWRKAEVLLAQPTLREKTVTLTFGPLAWASTRAMVDHVSYLIADLLKTALAEGKFPGRRWQEVCVRVIGGPTDEQLVEQLVESYWPPIEAALRQRRGVEVTTSALHEPLRTRFNQAFIERMRRFAGREPIVHYVG